LVFPFQVLELRKPKFPKVSRRRLNKGHWIFFGTFSYQKTSRLTGFILPSQRVIPGNYLGWETQGTEEPIFGNFPWKFIPGWNWDLGWNYRWTLIQQGETHFKFGTFMATVWLTLNTRLDKQGKVTFGGVLHGSLGQRTFPPKTEETRWAQRRKGNNFTFGPWYPLGTWFSSGREPAIFKKGFWVSRKFPWNFFVMKGPFKLPLRGVLQSLPLGVEVPFPSRASLHFDPGLWGPQVF